VTFGTTGFTYVPPCIRVDAGTTVTFSGNFLNHPFVGGEVINSVRVPATSGPFAGVTNTGTSRSFVMTTAGTFGYYCNAHWSAGMMGVVFVVP
jgi:plastocyanin